jgi:flagellar biosynthetic protein FliO
MGSMLFALGRMVLVLGLIIVLLVLLARFGRKWQGLARFGAKPAGRIEILSRRSLGKSASLIVVQVARRTFLVGQGGQQMTLLAELDGDGWLAPAASNEIVDQTNDQLLAPGTVRGIGGDSPRAWDAFIDYLREMTVRR